MEPNYTDFQVTNVIPKKPINIIEQFMKTGTITVDSKVIVTVDPKVTQLGDSILPEDYMRMHETKEQKPIATKEKKEKKIAASREFHAYFGKLAKRGPIVEEELRAYLEKGVALCPSTVTTHLLFSADLKGMCRPEIMEAAIPILVSIKPGFTFLQTLIRGLVRLDAWRLISKFICDGVSSKLNQFVLETLAYHIKRHNRKCLRELPRQGRIANRIRGHLKIRPSKWRHMLAGGSRKSVTSFMSNNDWESIEYKLLSVHILTENYRAFMRHDKRRFSKFLRDNPEIYDSMKKHRYVHGYPSQKDIYDHYLVPMKQEIRLCQK